MLKFSSSSRQSRSLASKKVLSSTIFEKTIKYQQILFVYILESCKIIYMSYSDIYFAILSVSTLAIAGVLLLCLFYFLSILIDIKKLSRLAKKEVEMIVRGIEKGMNIFGNNLSDEATSFVKTLFGLLLSQFAFSKGKKRSKISK